MDLKKDIKELILAVLIAAILVFVLNIQFFIKNLTYYFQDFRSPTAQQALNFDKEAPRLEPNELLIESLDVIAPILRVEIADENLFQKALQNGVVHYPGTAMPGDAGNAYIFGHSSDNAWSKGDYKTIFATLPQIELGAEILVSNPSGAVFSYIVTEKKVVSPKALEYLEQDNSKNILTLQTSYPIGTSFKRYIVIAQKK